MMLMFYSFITVAQSSICSICCSEPSLGQYQASFMKQTYLKNLCSFPIASFPPSLLVMGTNLNLGPIKLARLLFEDESLRPQVSDHMLQTTCCRPHVANHMLQTTCCRPHVADHMLQTTCCRPESLILKL